MNGGFETVDDKLGRSYRHVMPPTLDGIVISRLYSRGALLDGTEGNPQAITRRLQAEALLNKRLISPIQVHGGAIIEGRPIWAMPQRVRCDGIHLDRSFDPRNEVAASLRFADCAPVLIASGSPRPWCILLHSGYKGTTSAITATALRYARNFYGKTDMGETFVWIGPAIGGCCYFRLLSDPVTEPSLMLWNEANYRRTGDRVYFDIASQISDQAADCGVPRGNIFVLEECANCRNEYLYSYRAGDIKDRTLLLTELADW